MSAIGPCGLFDIADLLSSGRIMVIVGVDRHIERLGDRKKRTAIELLVTRLYRYGLKRKRRPARET